MTRLIYLSTFWTVLLDIMAWFIIHVAVVLVAVRIPQSYFRSDKFLYRTRTWEEDGSFYQAVFSIKKWKDLAPDGAEWVKNRGFPKRKLKNRNVGYLRTFLRETCRAELAHWIIMFFAPFFFLWNKPYVGWIMIFYAAAENLPLIMIQRYNRARLRRVIKRKRDPS